MSLLGSATLANISTPYYSGGGGGGGPVGPVVSTIVVNASTLAVSSITASGPGQSLNFPNGFEMPVGAGIVIAGGGAPASGDIEFSNSNGQLVGVSTINGAPYPPAGGAASVSSITTGGVAVGSALQALGPGAPTTAGKWYNASIKIDSATAPLLSTITPGDRCSILADTTVLGTIDMVAWSTTKGIATNPNGVAFTGAALAAGANMQFFGLMNSGATCPLFVVTDGVGWLTPLN